MHNTVKSLWTEDPLNQSSAFLKNQGQEDNGIHFTTNIQGRKAYFSTDRITLVELAEAQANEMEVFPASSQRSCAGVSLELSFLSANRELVPMGAAELPGHHHYFKSTQQSSWVTDVRRYEELRYPAVWEGVDLEISHRAEGLKMNWVLDRPERVFSMGMRWAGAERLELDAEGNLLVHHAFGTLIDPAPFAYQSIAGKRVPVACTYRIDRGFEIGFELIGEYDLKYPLVIDPVLQYTTYLGGGDIAIGYGVAVDNEGCAYVTGSAYSAAFPTTPGAFQTTMMGSSSVFVSKFTADGGGLIYSTFLSGSGSMDFSEGRSITVDTEGNAYVTGYTTAANFPVTDGAYQTVFSGSRASFITKLAVDGGNLIYSTYLSGNLAVESYSITIDSVGQAYIAGATSSDTFPVTPNAFQATRSGSTDAFVAQLAADGGSLLYSTYLGGSGSTVAYGVALDSQNHIYIAGSTQANDFPTTPSAFQPTSSSNSSNGFVTKFAVTGESLAYSTYLGGSGINRIGDIVINTKDQACVTGETTSFDFPVTPGGFQTSKGGTVNSRTVIAAIFQVDGTDLVASTYLGGNVEEILMVQQAIYQGEYGNSIAVDENGRIYITGATFSADFPTTQQVVPSTYGGNGDAYISILSADLSKLRVSYYLGGSQYDGGEAIAVKSAGVFYSAGGTSSADFPVTAGAYQESYPTEVRSAYLMKATFLFPSYQQASLMVEKLL